MNLMMANPMANSPEKNHPFTASHGTPQRSHHSRPPAAARQSCLGHFLQGDAATPAEGIRMGYEGIHGIYTYIHIYIYIWLVYG